MQDQVETHDDGLFVRQIHMRDVREPSRECDFIASTDAIDSHGEIVDQNTWNLSRFKSNPVVLWAHCGSELPIGQCTRVDVVDGRLECTIRFASAKANPQAELVWQSVLEGTLRAVSVGFWAGSAAPREGDGIWVLSQLTLAEISVVPIPSNPDALAKMKAKARAAFVANQSPVTPPAEAPKPLTASAEKEKTIMDPEKIIAERDKSIVDLNVKLADSTEKLKAVALEIEAQKTQNAHLAAERDVAVKRAVDAEAQVIEHEVESLVGKKITPAEKPVFVDLRKANKKLFDDMIAQRSDLSLTKSVISEPTAVIATPPPAVDTDPGGQKLFAEFSATKAA